jgi:hypothetical protein
VIRRARNISHYVSGCRDPTRESRHPDGCTRAARHPMSYQEAIRVFLKDLSKELGKNPRFEVTIAKHASFEMKVVLMDSGSTYEQIFDLSNGLSPRTKRTIRAWFEGCVAGSPNDIGLADHAGSNQNPHASKKPQVMTATMTR